MQVNITVRRPELSEAEREKRLADFKRATRDFITATEREKRRRK